MVMSVSTKRNIQLTGKMGYIRADYKDCKFDDPITKAIFKNGREIIADGKIDGHPISLSAKSDNGINFKGFYEWDLGDDKKEKGEVKFRLFINLGTIANLKV